MPGPSETIDNGNATATLTRALKSQYHAALAMLRHAIEKCPDELWLDPRPKNAFWQVAYHALYFAHLYMGQEEASFRPWPEHQGDVQHPDGIPGDLDPSSPLPLIPRPYIKDQALRYWSFVDGMVDETVDALDLQRRDCGFSWYDMPKLDHQILNIRHIQHHTGQLQDRVRAAADIGGKWVGAEKRDGI